MTKRRNVDGELSETERRALTFIRGGLVDAEIAVRLGMSTGDARDLIERLQRKLGVSSRSELRALAPSPPTVAATTRASKFTVPLPLLVLVSASIGLAVGLALPLLWENSDSGNGAATATAPAASTPVRVLAEFDGRRMEDAGQLFDPVDGQLFVSRSSDRAAATAVWLGVPGFINLATDRVQWGVIEGGTLEGHLADRLIQLRIQPVGATNAVYGSEQVAVYSTDPDDPRPVVLLAASSASGEKLAVHVDSTGRLFVAVDPLPMSAVLESSTGEELEVFGRQILSQLPVGSGLYRFGTKCLGMAACSVSFMTTESVRAPFSGEIVCEVATPPPTPSMAEGATVGQPLALTGESATVVLWQVSYREFAEAACDAGASMMEGEVLAPAGQYLLTAYTLSGEHLDLGLALDGSLIAGRFEPKHDCPCFPD